MTSSTPHPTPDPRPDLLSAYGDVASTYAIADDLIDDLLKIAAWGIHDSRRDELREKAKAARSKLSAIARQYVGNPAESVAAASAAPAERSGHRCPARIAYESGAVLGCQQSTGHRGPHWTLAAQWRDDDDRVIGEGSGHSQPVTSRCAAGCGDHVRPDDMQEMTDNGPAHVLCLMDGDDDDV